MSAFSTEAHATGLAMAVTGTLLVAQVTVNDLTMIVEADKVNDALRDLHGTPAPGMSVSAQINFELMDKAAFEALPEFQT